MDLEALKGKTLDDKLHADLVAHVAGLTTRAETADEKARKAVKESIDGRKTLKAERDAAFAKLGVDTAEELEALPDAKGQAEAAKQFEQQIKKLARERDDAVKAAGELNGSLAAMKRKDMVAEATDGLRFKHRDDARALIEARIVEEAGELLFKTDDGKLVALKQGVKAHFEARKDYLLPEEPGGQGSGFKGSGGMPPGGASGKPGHDLGGDRASRVSAIAQRFPELAAKG
jgi:hypothetical protein